MPELEIPKPSLKYSRHGLLNQDAVLVAIYGLKSSFPCIVAISIFKSPFLAKIALQMVHYKGIFPS